MLLIILIYLSIGVLLSFIGPLSKKINHEIQRFKSPNIYSFRKVENPHRKQAIFFFESFMRLITILFYPILYVILLIDFIKSEKDIKSVEEKDDRLFFWKTGGVGVINCYKCGFNEEITSFTHGMHSSTSGVQCQSCGKFLTRNKDKREIFGGEPGNMLAEKKCECGGKLEREEPLFCPKCKSHNLNYVITYIT